MNRIPTTHIQHRVLERVDIKEQGFGSPCWVSNRAGGGNGYTKMSIGGILWQTHRASYEAFIGAIPEGMQIDHLCKVRACCNPDHLEPVTCRDNLLRGDTITASQVTRTHCPQGHALSGHNLYVRPDGRQVRECRACRNSWRTRVK